MKLWSKIKPTKNVLVLDISSGSVGAGLVELSEGALPTLLKSVRVSLNLNATPTNAILESLLFKSLHNSLVAVGKTSVEKVIISFSSPWVTSRLRSYKQNSKIPFEVDQKFVTNILRDQEHDFANDLRERYTNESQVFNAKITNLSLNGYEASPQQGKKVSSLEIQFMMTASEKSLIERVEDEIIKIMGVKEGALLENFMYTYMKVFTNAFQNIRSALLVNMSNEVSDFLLVRNEKPLVSISLPFGPAFIARSIRDEFNVPIEVAYSYVSLFSEGVLVDEMMDRLNALFIRMEGYWSNEWEKIVAGLEKDQIFPNKIFLIGSVPNEAIVKTLLSSTFNGHEVIIVNKNSSLIKHLVDLSPGVEPDERLAVLAAFSNLV